MDCSINTSFDTKAQLAGGQEGCHLGPHGAESCLCNKTTEGGIHCNRLNSSPFLSRVIKDAPKKAGQMEDGVRPSRTKLVKEVRAIRRWWLGLPSITAALNRSLRCWGLRPSGPPAEPWGKDLMAEETISGGTEIGPSGTSTRSGMEESRWGGGCLAWRAAKMDGLVSATWSSEQANRTAPLKSPSSSLADTRVARGRGWEGRDRPMSGGSASSASCLLKAETKEPCRPWLKGTLRQNRGDGPRRHGHCYPPLPPV